LILVEAAKRYQNYDYWASSIMDNDEESSMASDASYGPQKLPLHVRDIKLQQGHQIIGSYSIAIRKCDVHVDKVKVWNGLSEWITHNTSMTRMTTMTHCRTLMACFINRNKLL